MASLQRIGPARLLPRVILAAVVGTTLLAGLGSGLTRLGWRMDSFSAGLAAVHGPLMIAGFLGTVISLERAVALAGRYPWSLVVPLVNAAGAAALLFYPADWTPRILLAAGSFGLVVLFAFMLRLHPTRDVGIMALGALAWLAGSLLWLAGWPLYQVVHWWTAFLVLTIVGERLELSRVRRLSLLSQRLLVAAVAVYAAGVLLTLIDLGAGIRLLGVGALFMAGWLLRYDIAGRTIRQAGLPRFIATCLLPGYVWLGVGGGLALWFGPVAAGPPYEAILHAFLLGFVFSMIFGHAPIILPALTGLRLDFHPIFYAHLALLHASLAVRLYGDLVFDFTARRWGGLFNGVAIIVFLAVTVGTVVRSNKRPG